MTTNRWMAAMLAAAAGMCAGAPALAQDSVSTNPDGGGGLPGDALDPWNTAFQCADYIVDLNTITSSTGNIFTIGPILKSSKTTATFFGTLVSSNAMSTTVLSDQPYAAASYLHWNTAGGGVHPTNNSGGMMVMPEGTANQFAVGASEFNNRTNNILGALVHYDPAEPRRMYVSRRVGAINQPNSTSGDFAQLGMGSVDAEGNLYFRGDCFGCTGLPTIARLGGGGANQQNVFRVGMADRDCDSLNVITDLGGGDASATDRIVGNENLARNTPSCIPSELAGRPVYIGSRFGAAPAPGAYIFEGAPVTPMETTTHLTTGGGGTAFDHRGNVSFSRFPALTAGRGTAIGTAAILGKSDMRSLPTDTLVLMDVDADGALVSVQRFVAPDSFSDSCESFSFNQNWAGDTGFDHYHSSVAFRGGNGQIAVGQDQDGRGLAAAVLYDSVVAGNNNPCNHIPVVRFDPNDPQGTAAWSLAAWIDCTTANGKAIRDGAGMAIGELATLLEVTGGTPQGPSLSAPAMDSVGNVYFLAAIQLYAGMGDDDVTGEGDDNFDTGLVRAVYDAANFCYELELIFTTGDIIQGLNADREYQIRFINIAAASAVSPGTLWSHNIAQTTWNNVSRGGLDPSDPQTLGGLILGATIIYDTNEDMMFEDPTAMGGDPTSPDEEYDVLLFIGADVAAGTPCPWDLNGDGSVGSSDLAQLLGQWGMGGGFGPADFNNDGVVNAGDLAQMLGAWGPCPE